MFKFLKLHIILDLFYEQMVLARRLRNETSVRIGENAAIRGHSRIDYYKNLSIGNNSAVNYGFQAIGRGKIKIGDFVQIGPNVMISTANHNILGKNFDLYPVTVQDVKIEDNVWIGANSIILAGVTIGEGSIVAAGSVVRHSIPKNSVVLGNPAKVVVKKPA
jgi:galactoside O-acetyltransferase